MPIFIYFITQGFFLAAAVMLMLDGSPAAGSALVLSSIGLTFLIDQVIYAIKGSKQ